ncbi:S-Ena type endospore appendage [Bacillus sp. AFS017274]|uniref:S-Ena type endospore appendage n=1 Tax=Bacillaceae TaxID=186817 RepID=UPI002570E998|nr:S-Ena type endospore appendage [Bacillus sp. AFS017274]
MKIKYRTDKTYLEKINRKEKYTMCFYDSCCPPAQIFQESICGNFNGPTIGVVDETVFTAPVGTYIEGTFEIFNSAASVTTVTGTVNSSTAPVTTTIGPVPPGNTIGKNVKNPTSFVIQMPAGTSGTYNLTLYKRILA